MSTSIRSLTVFSLLPLLVSPAWSAVIHVTDLNELSATSTTCTLRQAVRSANENTAIGSCEAGQNAPQIDQIHVRAGTHIVNLTTGGDEDSALTGDLDLLQNVDVRGVSTSMSVVDGTGGTEIDRLFDVHAGVTVVMQQLTLRGGNATDTTGRGGVIRLIATGTLTLDEIDLSLGTAKTGGGIYSSGALTLTDSHVHDNHTVVAGGAGNHGGGIAHDATGAQLTILDSEISWNTAEEAGAGLWVAGGPLSLRRSQVTDNVAGGSGGGLFVSSNNYQVHFSEFARNQASAGGGLYLDEMGDVQRCAIVFNQAAATGGGLHDDFGGFVRFSTIAGNSAPLGGGAYANSIMTLFDADTIAGNSGGGVHNASGAAFEITILADNVGGNCAGAAPAFGPYNIEDANTCGFVPAVNAPNFPNTDPLLLPLLDNGGPTRTMALHPDSPAIDAASSLIRMNCQDMPDQRNLPRGRPRTNNGVEDVFLCDIGAFEHVEPFRVNTLADAVDADLADDVCRTAGNACSLRAAIQQANALPFDYVIQIAPGFYDLSIPGTGENAGATGDLDIDPPLVIRGAGSAGTTVSGNQLDRVFDIGAPTHVATQVDRVVMDGIVIVAGDAGSENGGGILLRGDFPLELRNVALFGNRSPRGSAISSSTNSFFGAGDRPVRLTNSLVEANLGGMALFLHEAYLERSTLHENLNGQGNNGGAGEFLRVELVNSTVSGNEADATGAFFAQRAAVDHSTIHGNLADSAPGGVFLLERSGFRNSIVTANLVGMTSINCSSNSEAIFSGGYNITDTAVGDCELNDATDRNLTNAQLDEIMFVGGLALGHPPLPGSPAIDTGDPVACREGDQRNAPRPVDGDGNGSAICDVGAIEIPEPGFLAGLFAGCALLAGLSRRGRSSRAG
jgi:CSLREA domain-containing protein